jgi:hypothetical protein
MPVGYHRNVVAASPRGPPGEHRIRGPLGRPGGSGTRRDEFVYLSSVGSCPSRGLPRRAISAHDAASCKTPAKGVSGLDRHHYYRRTLRLGQR